MGAHTDAYHETGCGEVSCKIVLPIGIWTLAHQAQGLQVRENVEQQRSILCLTFMPSFCNNVKQGACEVTRQQGSLVSAELCFGMRSSSEGKSAVQGQAYNVVRVHRLAVYSESIAHSGTQ